MKTQHKILNKALALYNQYGYNDVGVRQIARALRISPGNLSYHFSKKEDIFLALLQQYSQGNDLYYAQYHEQDATIENFLLLMLNILKSQYRYRGLFLATAFIGEEIKNQDRTNYKGTESKRKLALKKIMQNLASNKQIIASDTDIDFLVSFLSLFGRFSIQEAFFTQKERKEMDVLQYYMKMLSTQVNLFATFKGKHSINNFRKKYLRPEK